MGLITVFGMRKQITRLTAVKYIYYLTALTKALFTLQDTQCNIQRYASTFIPTAIVTGYFVFRNIYVTILTRLFQQVSFGNFHSLKTKQCKSFHLPRCVRPGIELAYMMFFAFAQN